MLNARENGTFAKMKKDTKWRWQHRAWPGVRPWLGAAAADKIPQARGIRLDSPGLTVGRNLRLSVTTKSLVGVSPG